MRSGKTADKILFVETRPERRELIQAAFGPYRAMHLEFVPTRDSALSRIRENLPDLVFFPSACVADGTEFFLELRRAGRAIHLVLLTGQLDEDSLRQAIKMGIADFAGDDENSVQFYPRISLRVLAQGETERNCSGRTRANSELQRLRDQLCHSHKPASMGLLVSGVAHEINNPLAGAMAYTELLQMRISDESVKKDLAKILHSAERCKKIVENLLTFSRQRAPSRGLVSINDIIDRTIELRIYSLRANNVEILRDYDADPMVVVDVQRIQQVMLNILLNAEQAVAGLPPGAGRISFATRSNRKNRTITVRVVDNGPGIPRDILSRVFDPFFTTRPVGIGTGLGLSLAQEIIAEHHGSLRAESADGGGAAFIIELPTGAGQLQP